MKKTENVTHFKHVLHVFLVKNKWPKNLKRESDLWIYPRNFIVSVETVDSIIFNAIIIIIIIF
jgi:hypothetical protein